MPKLYTVTLKLSLKCAPLYQPCDIYFYKQITNVMKHLQHCVQLLYEGQEISSHKDATKRYLLLHHQASTPVYGHMLCIIYFQTDR